MTDSHDAEVQDDSNANIVRNVKNIQAATNKLLWDNKELKEDYAELKKHWNITSRS